MHVRFGMTGRDCKGFEGDAHICAYVSFAHVRLALTERSFTCSVLCRSILHKV